MPHYLNEVFIKAPTLSLPLRNSYQNLPFRKSSTNQHALSLTGPTLWNKIGEETKRVTNNQQAYVNITLKILLKRN